MALCPAKKKKGREGRTSDVFLLLFSKISGAEMNEHRKGARHLQKPIPGCMGRIVNILDLNAGMAGRKMLTDRANRDGSPVCRNRPGIPKKTVNPVTSQADEKRGTYEPKTFSSKKGSSGTPMKMLIAQEMLKGAETGQKPPNVIAKLMGLDALPAQPPGPTVERTSHEFYKHNVHTPDICPSDLSASTRCYGEQELGYLDKSTEHDEHPSQCYRREREYKDVFEIWPQPSRSNHRHQHPLSKNHNEDTNGSRMALVRQKFMEAKRLATDQKLLQTKEFQDALEVLNSNRDLFLKFLEEPSSLFSKHLQTLRACPTSPQTKCITVLKPSNAVRYKSGTEMIKQQTLEDEQVHRHGINWSPDFVHHSKSHHLSQPTRIVVLKPSPRKLQDLKSLISSPTLGRGLIKGRDHFEESGTEVTRGSREVAKDITLTMQESHSGSPMDETLFSSILSHGYVGDESSLNRSENEFLEDDGNFSDSEVVAPTSRHSWDYVYRLGSPYSLSSVSQTSYSPESSVIREAKKRLSERWAMVASHGSGQEQRLVHKSSSTLGEMLAISELNKGEGNNMLRSSSCSGEQDVRFPAACSLSTSDDNESGGLGTPRSLLRSKSVPVSSSAYDTIELNVKVSDSKINKSTASKDLKRSNSGKLSLKGKVSSLFFSKNKRLNKEKIVSSSLVGTSDTVQSTNFDHIGKRSCDPLLHTPDSVGPSQFSGEVACEISSLSPLTDERAEEVTSSTKAASAPENSSENQEQPSPISVLEVHFDDDLNSSSSRSSEELISRSPLIESVARSLAWDGGTGETPPKVSEILHEKDEDEEQYSFVKALLSSAGFGDEKSSSVLARWHSPDSPLDPLMLDKFLEHRDEESKCRKRGSNQRLLFDCVNAVLLDISWTTLWDSSQGRFRKSSTSHSVMLGDASVTEEVWSRIKEWFQAETNQGKNISLVVDRVLRKEVAERGWADMTSLETDEIGKEIQGSLLEELVEEALADLIPQWS